MGQPFQGKRTPNKLNAKWLENYRKLLLTGTRPLLAAQALGISSDTFYDWMRVAENHSEETPAPKLVLLFLQITKQSRAEFAARTMAQAVYHVKSTKDALDILRASMPEEFAATTDEGKQDLTVNQIIIGLVNQINARQAAITAPDVLELPE